MTERREASDDLDRGLWLTVAEIARIKGVSRQTVHERTARLVASGKLEVRGHGRAKRINVAQYDRAVGQTGDAYKESAAETRGAADTLASPGLRDHQMRAAQHTADLKFLDLEERLGRLVPIDEVKAVGVKIGEAIVRTIGQLPTYAESLASVVAKDGVQGARGLLKEIERELCTKIVAEIGKIGGDARPSLIETNRD